MRGKIEAHPWPTAAGVGRWLALLLAGTMLVGCDLGHRTRPAETDGGIDSGATDTDVDTDADGDSDTETEDTDWQYEDAGDFWDDGVVEIDEECGNDCRYRYSVRRADGGGSWWGYGTYQFKIEPGTGGTVGAQDIGAARYMIWRDWPDYALYHQRLLASYVLDETDHDLISGEATQYNVYGVYGGMERTRYYSFAYDAGADEFSYTVKDGGRHWSRTLDTAEAPLVMFNYHEFPNAPYGSHSALFAFLLAERYDWSAGGVQQIPIFAPEVERLDTVAVEEGEEDDTLIVHYPVESAKPLWRDDEDETLVRDLNDLVFTYEYGIPTKIEVRTNYHLEVVTGPSYELSLSEAGATTEQTGPTPLGGYSTSELAVDAGTLELAGAIDDPTAAGPHPTVVMIPGWTHQTRLGEVGPVDLYAQLADQLAAAGFLVVRMDARGAGDSQGAAETALVTDLVADTVATLNAVGDLAEAEGTELFLLTTGLGAHVAAYAALDSGANVAGLILLAPTAREYLTNGGDLFEHYLVSGGFHTGYAYSAGLELEELLGDLNDASYDGDLYRGHDIAAWQSLLALDLIDTPAALPPTLIAIGTEDHRIPVVEATDLGTALSGVGTTVTVEQLSGLTHAFTVGTAAGLWPEHSSIEAVDTSAVNAIVQWLDLQTGGE
jgi:pimeloyl-ACP methyl ester carboxylesterase